MIVSGMLGGPAFSLLLSWLSVLFVLPLTYPALLTSPSLAQVQINLVMLVQSFLCY